MRSILYAFLAFTVACSTAETTPSPSKKRGIGHGSILSGPAPVLYLVGGADPRWKMRNLMNDLIRVHEGSDLAFSAVPYSQALVEVSVKENVAEKNRQEELKSRSSYYKDETCFIIEAATKEEEVARFNRWEGRLQGSSGKVQSLSFRSGSFLKDLPVHTKKYFPNYEWENSTLACSEKIDLAAPFKLLIRPPSLDEDSESAMVTFSWNETP